MDKCVAFRPGYFSAYFQVINALQMYYSRFINHKSKQKIGD